MDMALPRQLRHCYVRTLSRAAGGPVSSTRGQVANFSRQVQKRPSRQMAISCEVKLNGSTVSGVAPIAMVMCGVYRA